MGNADSDNSTHPLAKTILILLIGMVFVAPIFRAGTTPLASLMLQWLALAVLIATLWNPRDVALSRVEWGILLLLVLTPVIYLIPLPVSFVDAMPGRDLYLAGEAMLSPENAPIWKAISIHPDLTLAASLAVLVPVAVFIGTRTLDARGVLLVVQVLLGVALIQTLIGLIQYGTAQSGEMLLAVAGGHTDSATGTYASRNNLAGLLAMALPIALALLYYSLGSKDTRRSDDTWRRRAAFFGSGQGSASLIYGAIALLILVGLVFTRSRMGIAMGMLGLVLTTVLFARRIGGSNTFGLTGTLIATALAFAVAIGLAPVMDRFSVTGVVEDGRVAIFSSALLRLGQLFPVGSGPGTFSSAFPPVQPVQLGAKFPNNAHNDYLEWMSDAGLIAAVLILLCVGLYAYQWTRVYVRGSWSRPRFLQAGAGVALLVLALHEFVDYNLTIPANQVVFAFLAGIFFMAPQRLSDGTERRRVHRRTPNLEPAAFSPPAEQTAPPADQIENPFRD